MYELTTTGNLVDYANLDDPITAVLERSELEAMLQADEPAGLWFEFAQDEDEMRLLTIELGPADIAEMLRRSDGDQVAFAIDADPVVNLFGDPDVEAHGMRGALAIAVVAAAVAAPAGLAASPQISSAAASAQVANPAARAQVANPAARAQVVNPAVQAQVVNPAAKVQVSKTLVLKAAGIKLLGRR